MYNEASPNNFIDRDPRSFRVSVADPGTAGNPESASLTLSVTGSVADGATPLLTQAGLEADQVVTPLQMLTSADVQSPGDSSADDQFLAHDGESGPVADDVQGDRTHRSAIDGVVQLEYTPLGGTPHLVSIPICGRGAADERRRVRLRIWVFKEPFDDVGIHPELGGPCLTGQSTGCDSTNGDGKWSHQDTDGVEGPSQGDIFEPFMNLNSGTVGLPLKVEPIVTTTDDMGNKYGPVLGPGWQATVSSHLQRTDLALAQACIQTVLYAPLDSYPALIDPPTTMSDGLVPEAELVDALAKSREVAAAAALPTPNDIIEVFFGANLYDPQMKSESDFLGFACPPYYYNRCWSPAGSPSYVYMAPGASFDDMGVPVVWDRVLAHEILHILTNASHIDGEKSAADPGVITDQYVFDWHALHDTSPLTERRLSRMTVHDARIQWSSPDPPGAPMDHGNGVLTPW